MSATEVQEIEVHGEVTSPKQDEFQDPWNPFTNHRVESKFERELRLKITLLFQAPLKKWRKA